MNRIDDYALIGDCRSAALVGRDGSIDWACLPAFDSPSLFSRCLDRQQGGSFQVCPHRTRSVARAYVEGTNVLSTTFTCAEGVVEVVDFMPVGTDQPDQLWETEAPSSIVRRVRCLEGVVDVSVAIAPRFEYATHVPAFRLSSPTVGLAFGGADALWARATHPMEWHAEAFATVWTLRSGEEAWVQVGWMPGHHPATHRPVAEADPDDLAGELDRTVRFWRRWSEQAAYDGEHAELVRRSALALKALTYAPTGAVIAAPTTSLPEQIGGERNWDYRYTWIRDSTLTLASLMILGYRDETVQFHRWLERTSAGRPRDLQIMYGIRGERLLPEFHLDHLDGHRGSRPVRVGNAAAGQVQLDMYGQILQAAYLYRLAGGRLRRTEWMFLCELAEVVCEVWHLPDHGIWEVRDEPRHFTHSKLSCWVALDRAVRLSRLVDPAAPTARWAGARDRLRRWLLHDAAPDGWFRQAADVPHADAATLMVPATGLLPSRHPLVTATVDRVMTDLDAGDGLIYRYLGDDGLDGQEGAFLLCSFWLVDCLTHAGRLDEADRLLGALIDRANDVGLLSEEVDPASDEALGNFPQAFTHMALVTSCSHLSAAKRGEIDFDAAGDYSERAVQRLVARRGEADPDALPGRGGWGPPATVAVGPAEGSEAR